MTNKKKKQITQLPWRHGVANSLKQTVNFIKMQDKDFACITRVQDKEFVTMPFDLYLDLLKTYDIANSLNEEEL